MTTFSGTIVGYRGTMGFGLGTLFVEETHGRIAAIPVEAGPCLRALRSAYGDRVIGREIEFNVDELGVLASFRPVEEVRA